MEAFHGEFPPSPESNGARVLVTPFSSVRLVSASQSGRWGNPVWRPNHLLSERAHHMMRGWAGSTTPASSYPPELVFSASELLWALRLQLPGFARDAIQVAMTPPQGDTGATPSSRVARRSHHACLTCRSVQRLIRGRDDVFGDDIGRGLTSAQAEEDPVSGGEAGVLELRAASTAVFLSREATVAERALRKSGTCLPFSQTG